MAEDENINDHIRNMMAALEMEPKASSFDVIMKKMEKRKKRRFFFILFAGIGLLSGALLLTGALRTEPLLAESPVASSLVAEPVEATKAKTPRVAQREATPSQPFKTQDTEPLQTTADRIKAPKSFTHEAQVNAKHLVSTIASSKSSKSQRALAKPFVTEPVGVVEAIQTTSKDHTDHTISKTNSVSENNTKAGSTNAITQPVTESPVAEPVEIVEANKQNSTRTNDSSAKPASFIFLEPKPLHLCTAGSLTMDDSLIALLTELPGANLNELQKAKRSFSLLLAIGVTPQLGAGLFSAGKNYSSSSSTLYDRRTDEFQSQYMAIKRKQNAFQPDYLYNFKLGFVFDNTWELWFSAGRQTIQYNEQIYSFATGAPILTAPQVSNTAYSTGPETGGIKNTFNYWSYAIEVNRLIRPRRAFQLKLGAGFHVNNLSSSHYVYAVSDNKYSYSAKNDPASETLYIADLNCGIIKPLGRRFQLRASPGIFCSLNSMFNSSYVISQRTCGFQMEVALAFRVFTK